MTPRAMRLSHAPYMGTYSTVPKTGDANNIVLWSR